MRTFVIADAHGHPEIIQGALDHGGFAEDRDRFVFAGDFFDRGTDPQGCLDLVERHATEVLLGNHDLAVLLDVPVWPQEPDSPGYRGLLVDKVLNKDPIDAWKAVTAVDGVLVSHAGISARYDRVFRTTCHGEPALLARYLNEEFWEAVRGRVGMAQTDWARDEATRGLLGDYGPFWFRPPPFTRARPLAGVKQVAGHSPALPELAKPESTAPVLMTPSGVDFRVLEAR